MNQDQLLKKKLGFWSLTATSFGGVIGSGWLFGAMYGAQAAGPASTVAWIIGGLMFIVMALVLVELALVKPESGGLARYPLYTNGALVASMIGWSVWLSNASNPPTESAGIVQYLSKFMPGVYNGTSLTGSGILLAIGLMVIFVVVNYFGVQLYAKINSAVTGLKLVVPVITLIAFIVAGFHPSNFTQHGGFAPFGWPAALGAIATSGIIFAYTGFESAINLAGEAVNPRKDIPKAVILAIVLAMIIYVGLQIVFVGVVPQKFLGSGWHGVNFNSPFADLALSVNLTWLYWVLMADSMISPAGSSFVFTAYNSRQAYGLAKNRYFPTYFGKVSERWGVPTRALILNFIVGLLYLVPLKGWQEIIKIASDLGIYGYITGSVSVLVFRRMGITKDNQKIKGMGILAPIGFVVGTFVAYWSGWSTLSATVGLLIVGLVIYGISCFVDKHRGFEVWSGIWLIVYLVVLLILSKLGSFGGMKVIPAPWDTILVAIAALLIFYWSVSSGVRFMKHKGVESALSANASAEDTALTT